MHSVFRKRWLLAVAAITALLMLIPAAASAGGSWWDPERTVTEVESLGEVRLELQQEFDGVQVGGLSSITYDKWRRTYYALSDDQGEFGPVRYYTLMIDFRDGSFDDGDLTIKKATTLFESGRTEFGFGTVDPEGFAKGWFGQLWMSSEGIVSADALIDPFIRRYNRWGRTTGELPVPDKYIPNGVDWGVRSNLGFESLNLTPNRRYLVTANEDALFQDGPKAGNDNGSFARILVYDLWRKKPVAEYVYPVNQLEEPTTSFGVNGIVEVLPLDNHGTMLVMERSFSIGGIAGGGTGNAVRIYEISTEGATDVLGIDALYEDGSPVAFDPVSKRELFNFESATDKVWNIEGMTFGPRLDDGRRSLVIVSDDNFAKFSPDLTQFFVLALEIENR